MPTRIMDSCQEESLQDFVGLRIKFAVLRQRSVVIHYPWGFFRFCKLSSCTLNSFPLCTLITFRSNYPLAQRVLSIANFGMSVIFIFSDESWHEVGGPLHNKGKGNAFGKRKICIPAFRERDLFTSFQA